jgi:hypothetical protein
MSTQGATLGRGIIRVPIWPLAVIVVATTAAAIGLTVIQEGRQNPVVTSVTETDGFWSSTVSHPRNRPLTQSIEQGAEGSVIVGISHVPPSGYAPEAAVIVGISHVPPAGYTPAGGAGVQNPGVDTSEAQFTPTVTWHRPVI